MEIIQVEGIEYVNIEDFRIYLEKKSSEFNMNKRQFTRWCKKQK